MNLAQRIVSKLFSVFKIGRKEPLIGQVQIKFSIGGRVSRGTAFLVWKRKGESLTVSQFIIPDPMTYWSEGTPIMDEASCIDASLPIGDSENEKRDRLDYYPQYQLMMPDQRAFYLKWLAGGKKEPLTEIGYGFVYFYGLERRVLVDHVDKDQVLDEVIRLLDLYAFSKSFDILLSRFLAYSIAGPGIHKMLSEEWFNKIFEQSRIRIEDDSLAVALAWLTGREKPIPVKLAMAMGRLDPRSIRSRIVDHEEFKSLFARKYREHYGDGLILKATERELKCLRVLHYQPGNPSGSFRFQFNSFSPLVRVSDVFRLRDKYAPIIDLWNGCVRDLK